MGFSTFYLLSTVVVPFALIKICLRVCTLAQDGRMNLHSLKQQGGQCSI